MDEKRDEVCVLCGDKKPSTRGCPKAITRKAHRWAPASGPRRY